MPKASNKPKFRTVAGAAPEGGKKPRVRGHVVLMENEKAPTRSIAGTKFEAFNTYLINQTGGALWFGSQGPAGLSNEDYNGRFEYAVAALADIAPKDAMEGLLAAQMVATSAAALECYRRAMLPEQTHVGREANLAHAGKLSRSYAMLVQALDKHRNQGKQTVRVEHVHVHPGGQAIVGNVSNGPEPTLPPTALIAKSSDEPLPFNGTAAELEALGVTATGVGEASGK